MKRSSSASGVSGKPISSYSSASTSRSAVFRSSSVSSGLDSSDPFLPMSNPWSRAAEKERRRLHLAKILIHFIPVVILLCAAVLWLFSAPVARGITVLHVIMGGMIPGGPNTGNHPHFHSPPYSWFTFVMTKFP